MAFEENILILITYLRMLKKVEGILGRKRSQCHFESLLQLTTGRNCPLNLFLSLVFSGNKQEEQITRTLKSVHIYFSFFEHVHQKKKKQPNKPTNQKTWHHWKEWVSVLFQRLLESKGSWQDSFRQIVKAGIARWTNRKLFIPIMSLLLLHVEVKMPPQGLNPLFQPGVLHTNQPIYQSAFTNKRGRACFSCAVLFVFHRVVIS